MSIIKVEYEVVTLDKNGAQDTRAFPQFDEAFAHATQLVSTEDYKDVRIDQRKVMRHWEAGMVPTVVRRASKARQPRKKKTAEVTN